VTVTSCSGSITTADWNHKVGSGSPKAAMFSSESLPIVGKQVVGNRKHGYLPLAMPEDLPVPSSTAGQANAVSRSDACPFLVSSCVDQVSEVFDRPQLLAKHQGQLNFDTRLGRSVSCRSDRCEFFGSN
jgi:hypothetical protein